MKNYTGIYKVKNKEKYSGDHTNVVYRSMWELACFKWCDNSNDVVKWSSEETIVPYLYEVDQKMHRYFVDLRVKYRNGKTVLIEIKPWKQTQVPSKKSKNYRTEAYVYVKNRNKWDAAEKYAKKRGWEFQIWTENELRKKGLLPKHKNKIKPFPKFKRKKKK